MLRNAVTLFIALALLDSELEKGTTVKPVPKRMLVWASCKNFNRYHSHADGTVRPDYVKPGLSQRLTRLLLNLGSRTAGSVPRLTASFAA